MSRRGGEIAEGVKLFKFGVWLLPPEHTGVILFYDGESRGSAARGGSFLEEEGTQGDTHSGHLHPTCPEGPELTFKLPLTGMVLKYQRKSRGECVK